jgi:hypothetical protein
LHIFDAVGARLDSQTISTANASRLTCESLDQ